MKSQKKHWIALECKAMRIQKGMSIMHVALSAEIHPNTLQNYEAGGSSMKIESIERVLNVLGYEMDVHLIET